MAILHRTALCSFLSLLFAEFCLSQTVIRERVTITPKSTLSQSAQSSGVLLPTDCNVVIDPVSRFLAYPITRFEMNGIAVVNYVPRRYSEIKKVPAYVNIMKAGTVLQTSSLVLSALVDYQRDPNDPDLLINQKIETYALHLISDRVDPYDGRVRALEFVMDINPNGNWWVYVTAATLLDHFAVSVTPDLLSGGEEASARIEPRSRDSSKVNIHGETSVTLSADAGLYAVVDTQRARSVSAPWRDVLAKGKVKAEIVLGEGTFNSSVRVDASPWGSWLTASTPRPAIVIVARVKPKPHLVFERGAVVPYGGEAVLTAKTLNQLDQPMAISSSVKYAFALGSGHEWGMLARGNARWNPLADTIINVFQFNDLPRSGGRGSVAFRAWEAEPSAPQQIRVAVSATDPTIASAETTVTVTPSPLAISVMPGTVAYGDSVLIEVKRWGSDGGAEHLPAGTNMLYEMVHTVNAGTLKRINGTQEGDEIFQQEPQILFMAREESPQPDSVEAWIAIKTWLPGVIKAWEGMAKVMVKKSGSKILLGETKYYQAKVDGGKLKIEELSEPALNGGIEADVWGDNPVTIVEGDKPGVYWEKQYPKYASPTFTGMEKLQPGLIRLVGRYWETGKNYKVKLKANYAGKTGELVIEVKKPGKLGTSNNNAIDVFGKTYNLDEKIIELAGKEGLLPQYIKAIVSIETGGRFAPSYRYEPFTDVTEVQKIDKKQNRPLFESNAFWIKSQTEIGTPSIPTNHSNLYDAIGKLSGYPGYKTVWEYYEEKKSIYSKRVYKFLNERWNDLFDAYTKDELDRGNQLTETQKHIAADTAEARLGRWIRFEFGGGGLEGKIAQTRISASYGIMQLVYYYSVETDQQFSDYEYPNSADYLPEDINIIDKGFTYGVLHFKKKLRIALKKTKFDNPSWSQGMEQAYQQGLLYYNGSSTYPSKVVEQLSNFLPLR